MKNFFAYLTIIIFAALQSTVIRSVEVWDTIPNLILVFAVCYSMYAEPVKATTLSLVCGLVYDLMSAHHLGLGALLLMGLGLLLSVLSSDYIHSNAVTVLIGVVLATFLFECVYTLIIYFMFDKISASYMFAIVAKEAVYNLVAAAVVMWWSKYLAEYEVRSF